VIFCSNTPPYNGKMLRPPVYARPRLPEHRGTAAAGRSVLPSSDQWRALFLTIERLLEHRRLCRPSSPSCCCCCWCCKPPGCARRRLIDRCETSCCGQNGVAKRRPMACWPSCCYPIGGGQCCCFRTNDIRQPWTIERLLKYRVY